MKMAKRMICVLMTTAIVLSGLAACGKTRNETNPVDETLATTAETTEAAQTTETVQPTEEPWKTALAEDLFQKYGVLPEYYEDLGDGIYQVYVEVGGEIVPFVTVNSATGDYHG